MFPWMLILCVIPTIVTTITISPNGNSPETKMIGGMMVDKKNADVIDGQEISRRNILKINKNLKESSTKLAINERYRRLIPYMTFYYANDLVPPPSNTYNHKIVEVEKAKIVEAGTISPNERQPKVIYTQRHKNIPRYQGNRLTQFNIASSNPTKLFYKDADSLVYQNSHKSNSPQNSALLGQKGFENHDLIYDHYVPKQIKAPSVPFAAPPRKLIHSYQNEDYLPNVQYFSSEQDGSPNYKLVPYEQTPPVKVSSNILPTKQHYSSAIPNESVYVKSRPSLHPQPFYISHPFQVKKQPAIVSEMYYERRTPVSIPVEPVIESGFRPIIKAPLQTTETPYTSTVHESEESVRYYNNHDQPELQVVEPASIGTEDNTYKPQFVIEQPPHKQIQDSSNSVTLAELLNSLQINKSIPKPITRENISSSIRTLLQVLNTLKAAPLQNELESVVVSSPKPFENPETLKPVLVTPTTEKPEEFNEEHYLAPIHTPSQHLDDYSNDGGNTQRFPLPVTSDEEGGTPGRPGVDYPTLTVIPPTKFDCKTQRYKGFFADTETRCQVWHYCDLNGGQASFLCPNGTIFSQAALTCDWWFNVRCASTAQLYVLNESLYKYILPHSPKFPEDYSGPLVDKYLTLKFKEMEEQFKKNKNKKVASEKMDSDKNDDSNETTENSSTEDNAEVDERNFVNQADVIVASSGNSGNVQRLQDE